MTEQKQRIEAEKKAKAMAKSMGEEMITVNMELFSPFVDFLKDFLRYFGSKKTLEDLCREMIYEQVGYLYNELHDFADKSHFLETKDWYMKHSHIGAVTFEDEETETEEA